MEVVSDTIDAPTTGPMLDEFIDLGANVQLSVHRVSPGSLFDLMQNGRLRELKREVRNEYGENQAPYLVGRADVNGIEIILFSSDLSA